MFNYINDTDVLYSGHTLNEIDNLIFIPLPHRDETPFKGIYLSKAKALTCMNFFLYKKNVFYQGDGYLWPHCFINNLYILHGSHYAPTYSF